MKSQQKVYFLSLNNQIKYLDTIIKTAITIKFLLENRQKVTLKKFSELAKISRSSLYSNRLARSLIEEFKEYFLRGHS